MFYLAAAILHGEAECQKNQYLVTNVQNCSGKKSGFLEKTRIHFAQNRSVRFGVLVTFYGQNVVPIVFLHVQLNHQQLKNVKIRTKTFYNTILYGSV